MRRMAFAVVTLLACWASPARADTLPLITGLPTTYTPGQAFTFNLSVPPLTDFNSYTLELVFTTEPINAPLFAEGAAAVANYVYPDAVGFQSTLTRFMDTNQIVLTITDTTAPGVVVTPGTNDQLATITVTPDVTLTGPIQLSIGVDSLFSYNMEQREYPFLEGIPPINQSDPPAPVPAPAGVVLFAIGGLLVMRRLRK